MAEQIRKGYLELRINAMEEQMDNLESSFQDTASALVNLTQRVETLESLLKEMQEKQKSASTDKTVKPSEVVGECVEKRARSVHETVEGGGRVLEGIGLTELENTMQGLLITTDSIEEMFKMSEVLHSFQSTL
jgi:DNA repair exonuclease SbcCD ATPase subunit